MPRKYDLIGGPSHGDDAIVPDAKETYAAPVYVDEEKAREPSHTEEYSLRKFAGEEFGDGYECFGLSEDDEMETRELARMELKRRSARANHGCKNPPSADAA